MWIDYKGVHTRSGAPATINSDGWFCNCCNYKVRRKPRSMKYKTKLRGSNIMRNTNMGNTLDNATIDLTYFNKQRATMMQSVAICILKGAGPANIEDCLFGESAISKPDMEVEFSTSFDKIIKLAYILDPPNKMSLILEFERVKLLIGTVPTKIEFEKNSTISLSTYETEFVSWEYMLERLGYDPWYREQDTPTLDRLKRADTSTSDVNPEEYKDVDTSILLENLRSMMDAETLELFNILDGEIKNFTKKQIEKLIQSQSLRL